MEKQVNEIISKIMNSKNLSPDDLNTIILLHKIISDKKYEYNRDRDKIIYENSKKVNDLIFGDEEKVEVTVPTDESYIFERQIKRLEMALRDKLKQINIYLSEDYLDNLENILFHRSGSANIKDLRLINNHEIAIIRENSIQLGDFSYDADCLSAGMSLQEEAYLHECSINGEEPDYYDPKEIFSHFYEDMDNKINDLKKELNILNRDVDMYFDKNLDDFYFNDLKTFRVILTELPNKIEIYEVDITQNKWIPKKISGEGIRDLMDKNDFSLLEESRLITYLKQNYKGKFFDGETDKFDIEIVLDKFKQSPFSLEVLINTYNSLFNNNNCMFEENKVAINRLMYLTAEKLVEKGFEYEKAFNYSKAIFDIIVEYKKQIISAINGENTFPEDSLVGIVKKVKKPNN